MGLVVAAIDFDGEADSLGKGEGAAFFLSAADNPIGANPNAAMHAAAISCGVCFIIVCCFWFRDRHRPRTVDEVRRISLQLV